MMRSNAVVSIVFTLFMLTLGPAPVKGQERLALLVGVSDYPGPHVTPLPSSVNDAQAVNDFLMANGYDGNSIQLSKNPTRAKLLEAFDQALHQARDARVARGKPLEQFVFFYSGHGATVEDGSGGDIRDEGDGDLSDEALVLLPESHQKPKSIDDMLVRDDRLFEFLKEISNETNQLVVILDACHSGGLFRAVEPDSSARRFPTKSISERSLLKYLSAVDADGVGLRENGPPRARDIVRDKKALPRELEQIHSQLLFIAASSAYQEAAAGDPRSQFTDRMMAALVYRRQAVLDDLQTTSLTIEGLDKYVTEKLAAVQQTPVVFTRGIDKTTRVFGELFPSKPANIQTLENEVVGFTRQLSWRLMLYNDNERLQRYSANDPLPKDQQFQLQIEPTSSRFLYVIHLDPDAGPSLILPESRLGQDENDYLLPARFSVTIPRDGPLRFTGAPATEVLRVVLSPRKLNREEILQLQPLTLADMLTPEQAASVASKQPFQMIRSNLDRDIYLPDNSKAAQMVFDIPLKHM